MTTHPGKQQRKPRQRWPWAVGILAALSIVLAVAEANDSTSGADEYDARDICRQAVEDRLVSPSSADFSRPDVNELVGSSSEAYRVVGHVDAENRLGASVRIDYECKARHISGTEWELIDLQADER